MSAHALSDAQAAGITARLAARRPLSTERARKPLGLSIVAEPEPEERDEPELPIGEPPLTRSDDRAATLLDCDYLIRQSVRRERKYTREGLDVLGEACGEHMVLQDHERQLEIEAKIEAMGKRREVSDEVRDAIAEQAARISTLEALVTDLRVAVARLEGAKSAPPARALSGLGRLHQA
jgi:hypothetical protein